MNSEQPAMGLRLGGLPIPAKVMLTAFLAIIGLGYLSAVLNIYFHHQDADLEPGMSLDDLRRTYHGLEKEVAAGAPAAIDSPMLKMVRPDGDMRKYLEREGEETTRALVSWLEAGAKRENFTKTGLSQEGDPSAQEAISESCVRCHNALRGDKQDAPYAADRDSPPDYDLVIKYAAPPPAPPEKGTMRLEPPGLAHLVQVTHAHILSIPVFVLIVGCLFFLTGQRPVVKAILGPLPMIAVCCDILSWWLARPLEPFIYIIALMGAVFGASFGLQILCILKSLWMDKKE